MHNLTDKDKYFIIRRYQDECFPKTTKMEFYEKLCRIYNIGVVTAMNLCKEDAEESRKKFGIHIEDIQKFQSIPEEQHDWSDDLGFPYKNRIQEDMTEGL